MGLHVIVLNPSHIYLKKNILIQDATNFSTEGATKITTGIPETAHP